MDVGPSSLLLRLFRDRAAHETRVAPANRPKENRVSSTFSAGLSPANSAKESDVEAREEPTAADMAA
jgi:hypothetical protein